ncbi:heterokaryon incompatibility protein-domain-containing protein [Hypomontagnella monticulosa]|nr:heterokaryon incompatibility protein-domain-containing protein [Hypomontagnella monticulosa]
MSQEAYHFLPLDHARQEIRVLHLLPGQFSDPISCRLSHDSLEGNPTYIALSYVWGDGSNPQHITLENTEFSVTANLYTALQFLRRAKSERILWIDAICINQNDILEREHQVSIICQVYSKAQLVFCWLATPNDNGVVNPQGEIIYPLHGFHDFTSFTSRFGGPTTCSIDLEVWSTLFAILFLGHFSCLQKTCHLIGSGLFTEGFCGTCDRCQAMGFHVQIAPTYRSAFEVLSRWINHAWWDRVWTVQEVGLAKEAWILIYHFAIPFRLLHKAGFWMKIHAGNCCLEDYTRIWQPDREVLNRFGKKLLETTPVRFLGNRKQLYDHLRSYRKRQASDPRDKVYALLGMSMWEKATPLRSDYSIDVKQVYINTTMKCIEETNSLSILEGIMRPSAIPNLPSWVHDWTITDDITNGFEAKPTSDELYSTGGELTKATLCCNSELLVDGIMAGMVTSLGLVWGYSAPRYMFIKWERMIAENGLALNEAYMNGQSRSDAFRSTMGGDLVVHPIGQLAHGRFNIPHYTRAKEDDREVCRDWWDVVENDKSPECSTHMKYVIQPTVADNRFFLTDQGLMGIGPTGMRVGDKVYVIRGSQLPYILRDISIRESKQEGCRHLPRLCFGLIGSSYVHGIMDGEVLQDPTKTQVEIHLC